MKPLEAFTQTKKKPWQVEGIEWREVRLGDKVNLVKGAKPRKVLKTRTKNSLPYLTTEYFREGIVNEYVPIEENKVTLVQGGNLVIIADGSRSGELFFSNTEGVLVSTMAKFEFNENEINKKFLYWFLNTHFEHLNKSKYTATPHVNKNHLKNLKIPLPFRNGKPDLETQKKIVEYIEANFEKIDRILEKKKRELEQLDELWESVLDNAFKPKGGEEWKEVRLREVAKEVKSGGTPSRKNKDYWENGTIPWVKIQDIPEDGYVVDTEEKITENGLNNSSAKLLPKGTILFTIFATIGRVGILNIEAATNQAIAGIILKEDYNQKYIYWVLRKFGEKLAQKGRGGAQNNVNLTFLKNLKIPVSFRNGKPDIEKQKEIADYLDSVYEKIKALKEKIQNQITQLEKMKESILDEVFNYGNAG